MKTTRKVMYVSAPPQMNRRTGELKALATKCLYVRPGVAEGFVRVEHTEPTDCFAVGEVEHVGTDRCFSRRSSAEAYARQWCRDQHGTRCMGAGPMRWFKKRCK